MIDAIQRMVRFQFALGSPDTQSHAVELSTSSYDPELDPEDL